MNLVIGFNQPQHALLSLVGGKGSNLIQLASAGFPVPPGFVVTALAYKLFAAEAGWLDQALAAFDFDDLARLARQCAELRERLRTVPLPAAVEAATAAALAELGAGAGTSDAFAVRSTSTL